MQDVKRYFEHSGMYDYIINNIEVVSTHGVNITLQEVSPSGGIGGLVTLTFSNEAGYLCIKNALTEEDFFEHTEYFGWDEETINYIRYGKKQKEI